MKRVVVLAVVLGTLAGASAAHAGPPRRAPKRAKPVAVPATPAPAPSIPELVSPIEIVAAPKHDAPPLAPDREEPVPSRPPRARDPSEALVVLDAAFGVAGRSFDYNDRLSSDLRSYKLAASPFAKIAVLVYPLSGGDHGALRDLGLHASYGRAMLVSSRTAEGATVDTSWHTLEVGPRFRIRLGGAARTILELGAGYTQTGFDVAGDPANPTAVPPAVRYQMLEATVGARSSIGRFALFGALGAGHCLSLGELGDRFPNASAERVAGELGLGVQIASGIEVRGSVNYARVFASLDPTPGNRLVAGGTLDTQQGAMAGVAFAY